MSLPSGTITIHIGDSSLTPLAGTTTATRQLYMSGNAVYTAARQLRDQILDGVAKALDEPVESLAMDERGVVGSNRVIPIQETLALCLSVSLPTETLGTFYASVLFLINSTSTF